jgi:hypothetical protein
MEIEKMSVEEIQKFLDNKKIEQENDEIQEFVLAGFTEPYIKSMQESGLLDLIRKEKDERIKRKNQEYLDVGYTEPYINSMRKLGRLDILRKDKEQRLEDKRDAYIRQNGHIGLC